MPDQPRSADYPATLDEWNHAARMAAWFAEDEARHIIRKRTASWLKDAGYREGQMPARAADDGS